MMEIISKELLQCLNKHLTIYEVISNDKNRIDNNIYWRVKEIDILQSKNIYEVSIELKEWAYSQGYMMKIENHYPNSIRIQIRKPIPNSMYKEPWKRTFKNEVEAMVEVCEWILNHKKKGI